MLGDQINYVEAGFPYVDAGATATDDLDGEITNKITKTGDVVDTSGAFYSMRSCREIKEEWRFSNGNVGSPNSGVYAITTHVGPHSDEHMHTRQGAFTRQDVFCDFTSDAEKAYTYYMCTGCEQAKRDGSTQGGCAAVGLEMASFHSEGAKTEFDAKFFGTNESSEYLCSTNDQDNTMSAHRHTAIVKENTHNALAGTYVINYHVKDSSQNKECSSPSRTVIVRDTLPPVISLHLDKKLIHVSDHSAVGLSDGNLAGPNPAVNKAGDPTYNPNLKDMLMAEQASSSSNTWLIAAAASAVTGLALLSASSKRTPVSVPV